MKDFPSHLAHAASEAWDSAEEQVQPDLQAETHPLADQLEKALAKPGETSIGTYARIVDQIMGEMSLVSGHLGLFDRGARKTPGGGLLPRARIPMTEEEEQRIVECLAGYGLCSGKTQ